MAVAVSADRLRTTAGNGLAAMRGHPLLLLPPLILLVSAAIVFVLMSFVTVTDALASPDHPGAGADRFAGTRLACPEGLVTAAVAGSGPDRYVRETRAARAVFEPLGA
jgi:hypothetical protein